MKGWLPSRFPANSSVHLRQLLVGTGGERLEYHTGYDLDGEVARDPVLGLAFPAVLAALLTHSVS